MIIYPFTNLVNSSLCDRWIVQHNKMHQSYWPMTLTSMILSVVNMSTNMMAFVIFFRDATGTILNSLLMALSLCEVLFQFFYFIHLFIDLHLLLQSSLVFNSFSKLQAFGVSYLWIIIPALTASHIARNWMVVMISFYRFEVLIRTFSNKWILFRKERIMTICWFIVFLAVVISIPRTVERKMHYCTSTDINNTRYYDKYILIAFGQRVLKYKTYYTYVYSIVMLFLFQNGGPTFLVCFVSIMVMLKINERKIVRRRLKNFKSINETSVTQMENTNNNSWSMKEFISSRLGTMRHNRSVKMDMEKNPSLVDTCYLSTNVPEISRQYTMSEEYPCTSPPKNGRKSRKQSKVKVNPSNKENSGGRLIIILCVLFSICEMPLFFSKLIYGISVFLGAKMNSRTEILGIVANFATAIDSFANFFIYLLSNRQFRFLLWDLFIHNRLCRPRRNGT